MGAAVVAVRGEEAVTAKSKEGVTGNANTDENNALAVCVIGIGKHPVVALVAELVARLVGGGFECCRPASVFSPEMPLRKEPLQKPTVLKIQAEPFLPDGKKRQVRSAHLYTVIVDREFLNEILK